ncbi:MAG: Uma2 family endonuclease [Trueperaceae bacterium]
MNWSEIMMDPQLQNLPYKIEQNEKGQIVMSPASNEHGLVQSEIISLLQTMKKNGRVLSECSVQTSMGVKVADVVWLSKAFFKQNKLVTPYQVAPEVCIEITSFSNTKAEINEKIELYLAKGAKEVWVCNTMRAMEFYDHRGQMKKSKLFPNFPKEIDLGF